ncbi:MAG TPA: PRC-barrel domain-containing protein [Beijerinckiaceae bacterium]|jgi:hypothetical protein
MAHLHYFQSQSDDGVYAFSADRSGATLPPEHAPWSFVETIGPDGPWHGAHRAAVNVGVAENGFFLVTPPEVAGLRHTPRDTIESDRVEGTRVYDREDREIGVIKRLLIEKVSGRVISVDVTFGGFMGLGVHHRSVPWTVLRYDPGLGGYVIEMEAAEIGAATSVAPQRAEGPPPGVDRRRWEQADGD